ncbi:hypothetical protein R1flu_013117 [Riccia fluitans]|uniref:Uncharacterized protein n=1 Tax=Riccia fluitans TaxID=41844 RepID=A0ABD1ZDK8_9MARC
MEMRQRMQPRKAKSRLPGSTHEPKASLTRALSPWWQNKSLTLAGHAKGRPLRQTNVDLAATANRDKTYDELLATNKDKLLDNSSSSINATRQNNR